LFLNILSPNDAGIQRQSVPFSSGCVPARDFCMCIYTAMHTTRAHGATMCQPEKKEKKFPCKKSFVSFYYLQPMYKAAAEREKERASKRAPQQLNQCSMSLFSVVLNT